MKRILIALVICSMLLIFNTKAFAADQSLEPKNFRGVEWGSSPEAAWANGIEMVDLGTDEKTGIALYARANDRLSIADIELEYIGYGYLRGQFCLVMMRTTRIGFDDYVNLEGVFLRMYGNPTDSEEYRYGEKMINWKFDNVVIEFDRYWLVTGPGQEIIYFVDISYEFPKITRQAYNEDF